MTSLFRKVPFISRKIAERESKKIGCTAIEYKAHQQATASKYINQMVRLKKAIANTCDRCDSLVYNALIARFEEVSCKLEAIRRGVYASQGFITVHIS